MGKIEIMWGHFFDIRKKTKNKIPLKGNGAVETIIQLFSQYSLEGIVLLIIALAVILKFLLETSDFFKEKVSKIFKKQSEQERRHQELMSCIEDQKKEMQEIKNHLSIIDGKIEGLSSELEGQKQQLECQKNHLIDNTKINILMAHAKYCYELGAIDDSMKQNLEYLYVRYKENGGNSFVDDLMSEIRELKTINPYELKGKK